MVLKYKKERKKVTMPCDATGKNEIYNDLEFNCNDFTGFRIKNK